MVMSISRASGMVLDGDIHVAIQGRVKGMADLIYKAYTALEPVLSVLSGTCICEFYGVHHRKINKNTYSI